MAAGCSSGTDTPVKRDVGLAVPSIPPRKALLQRALTSAFAQTHPFEQYSVVVDFERRGAGHTRNRAKNALTTTWTAFLDDDDELLPHHVRHLLDTAEDTGADVVYPWFKVIGGTDPFPGHRGLQWSAETPHIFPITTLIRTSLAQSIDFEDPSPELGVAGEDWTYWQAIGRAGAKVVHTPEITWQWHHDSANTAGRSTW